MKERREDGFTLVEVIVALLMMGIFMMAMAGMVRFYQNTYIQNRSVSTELQDANLAMQMVVRELRGGTNLSIPDNATLSFTDSGGTAITYHFDEDSGILDRNSIVVAQDVTNAEFIVDTVNPDTVFIRMTVNAPGDRNIGDKRVTLNDSVKLRNMGKSAF